MSTLEDSSSSLEVFDHNAAAKLLFLSCPDYIKTDSSTEVKLDSPESFAFLLYRSEQLFRQVDEARGTGDFDGVWERCLQLARPQELSESLKRGNQVPDILRQISENLKGLVNGAISSPLWTLESTSIPDVVKLDLASLYERHGPPSMLLHNLGCFEEDPILEERLRDIYSKNQNTFLVNASATGKTRLLIEGLLHNWGFYFTAHADIMEAGTLDTTLEYGFFYESDMVRTLPQASELSFNMTLDKNREIVRRRFTTVLLAHLLVFRDFLRTAIEECGSVNDLVHRRRWLLAQLHHRCLHKHEDIFSNLLYALEWESSAYVYESLIKVSEEIKPLLPNSIQVNGLFVVIDEANVAIKQLWCSHDNDQAVYPALKEIINLWEERLRLLNVPITFVVSGTEIPTHYFPSSSKHWSSWKWTSNTGAFDHVEVQKKYFKSFLPEEYLETPSGQALIKRVWDWCRPRHRLTASLVAMLLQDGLAHPHGVLNRYIEGLTMYAAHDADEFTTIEGPCDILPFFHGIGSLVSATPRVQFTTHQVIFHYIVTGKHPAYFDAGKIELVTSGIGQFIDREMQVISLDQPGPTVAAAMWLSDDTEDSRSLTSFRDFCSYFHDRWPDGDTYATNSYIAFYFAHVFTSGRMLNDVFTIPFPPAWIVDASQFANLVMLRKDREGITRELVLEPTALLPDAPSLGFVASTAEDVFAWLNHERFGAFCLCPPDCGAELMFVLKLNGKYLWVLLRTVGRRMQTSSEIDFEHEFEQLTGKGLFSNADSNFSSSRILDAFNTLPNMSSTRGDLSVLRVLASFPSAPALPRKVSQRIEAPPVAILNVETFESVTESFVGKDLVENLLSSMQDRRPQFTDEMFNLLNNPPRLENNDKSHSRHVLKADSMSSELSPQIQSKKSRSKMTLPRTRSRTSRSKATSPLSEASTSQTQRYARTILQKEVSLSLHGEKAPSSPRLTQRASPGSPYPRVGKKGADAGLSLEHPPVLRRSPKEHNVSSSKS